MKITEKFLPFVTYFLVIRFVMLKLKEKQLSYQMKSAKLILKISHIILRT